jgi:hypothetical protein
VLSKTKIGRSRSAPRRRVVTPRPSVSAPERRPRTPSPEAAHRPKPRSSLGRPHPTTHRSTRRATRRRATHAVPAGRAPLGPAVRQWPPSLVRRTTAGASPRRHRRSSTRPIKGALASPRASTEPPATIAALAPSLTFRKCPEPSNHLFPSLGLAHAQALTHCPAKRLPSPSPEPPRPPPPVVAACRCRAPSPEPPPLEPRPPLLPR